MAAPVSSPCRWLLLEQEEERAHWGLPPDDNSQWICVNQSGVSFPGAAGGLKIEDGQITVVFLPRNDGSLPPGIGDAQLQQLKVWSHYGGSIPLEAVQGTWSVWPRLKESDRKLLLTDGSFPMPYSARRPLQWSGEFNTLRAEVRDAKTNGIGLTDERWQRLHSLLDRAWVKASQSCSLQARCNSLKNGLGVFINAQYLLATFPPPSMKEEHAREALLGLGELCRSIRIHHDFEFLLELHTGGAPEVGKFVDGVIDRMQSDYADYIQKGAEKPVIDTWRQEIEAFLNFYRNKSKTLTNQLESNPSRLFTD